MSLNSFQESEIKNLLRSKIMKKLESYNPETKSMPFHFRLLGKDRMALYSFIQSVNTMLGQSIFEQAAKIIVGESTDTAFSHYKLTGYLTDEAVLEIDSIMNELRGSSIVANAESENSRIKSVANTEGRSKSKTSTVDLMFVRNDIEHYIEIKTVKPNIDIFTKTKEKLLEWKAMRYNTNPHTEVKTFIAIPYNPEAPKPYARWTMQGMFDMGEEVLVEKEFWDLLGGDGTFKDLLNVFEITGIELRESIDRRFSKL